MENNASPVRHSECTRARTGSPLAMSPRVKATWSLPVASSSKPCMVKVAQGVGSREAAMNRTVTGYLDENHGDAGNRERILAGRWARLTANARLWTKTACAWSGSSRVEMDRLQ